MNFVKANIANFFSAGLIQVLNLIISILEARVLGPSELGRYQIFISTRTMAVTFCALGLGQASIYFRNNKKHSIDDIVSTTFKAEGIIGLLMTIALIALFLSFHNYFGVLPFGVILVFSLGSTASLFSTAMSPLLVADMRVLQRQAVGFVCSLFTLAILAWIYFTSGSINVDNILVVSSVAAAIGSMLLFYYFKHDFHISQRFNMELFKQITVFGVKLSANNIATLFLQNAPVYMLSWFSIMKLEDVGLYSRAIAICALATFVNTTVGPLLYAKFSASTDKERVKFSKTTACAFLLINICLTTFILFAGRYLIILLYGNEYASASLALSILAVTLILNGISELVNNLLSSVGKPEYLLYNLLITLVFLIPMLYVGISLWGLLGCAYAVVFATFIKTLLLIRSLKKFLPVSYRWFFFPSLNSIKSLFELIKHK